MRKLIVKILIIFLPVAVFYTGLYLMPYFFRLEYPGYTLALADTDKQELLRKTLSPKIIFVGGSNLAYSLDSKKIEKALNRPVVNMGLDAGFGLSYMINEIKSSIKPGDIIVLATEYEHYFVKGYYRNGDSFEVARLLYTNPAAARYLGPLQKCRAVLENTSYLTMNRIRVLPISIHVREQHDGMIGSLKGWNENGDWIAHLDKKPPSHELERVVLPTKIEPGIIPFLNNFKSFVSGKGAKVFLSFPPLTNTVYRINREQIAVFYQELKKNSRIEILGLPSDYVFPDTLFFDMRYHTNKTGREIRTEKIIADLKERI